MSNCTSCQTKLLLTRKYDSDEESVKYTCCDRNGVNRMIYIDVFDEPLDSIAEMDEKVLSSIRPHCQKCPNIEVPQHEYSNHRPNIEHDHLLPRNNGLNFESLLNKDQLKSDERTFNR